MNATTSSREPKRPQVLKAKGKKWESMKADIRRIYLEEMKTLPEVMREIERIYKFTACERTWKMKLSEWCFAKYVTENTKNLVPYKSKKRVMEGKETIFYQNGFAISSKKIAETAQSKRRRISKQPAAENDSPTASPWEPIPGQMQGLQARGTSGTSGEHETTIIEPIETIFDQIHIANGLDPTISPNSAAALNLLPITTNPDQILRGLPPGPANVPDEVIDLNELQPTEYCESSVLADNNLPMSGVSDDMTGFWESGFHPVDFGTVFNTNHPNPQTFFNQWNGSDNITRIRNILQGILSPRTPPAIMPPPSHLESPNNSDCGAFDQIEIDFDFFSPVLNTASESYFPGTNFCSDGHSPDDHLQNGSLVETQVNLLHKSVENLPWFQLQRITHSPGFWSINAAVKNTICSLPSSSRIPASILGTLCIEQACLSVEDRHQILSELVNGQSNNEVRIPLMELTNNLLQLIPERMIGEVETKVHQLLDPSNKFPLFQLFEFALKYFSSNNLLSTDQTDTFLRWIIEKKLGEVLILFLQTNLPTLCAFASRILEGAVRIGNVEFLSLSLSSSIDSRVLSGFHGGIMLRELMDDSYIDDRNISSASYSKVARILLDNGADPDVPPEYPLGATTLYFAAGAGNIEIVNLLFEKGADINAISNLGVGPDTALGCAVENKNMTLLLRLLELGAKVDISHIERLSVLEWAATSSPQAYDILIGRSDKSQEQFHVPGILYAAREGRSFLSSYIDQSHGLPESLIQKTLEASLVIAMQSDWKSHNVCDILELLVEVGVDVNTPTKDSSYDYALVKALYVGDLMAVKILLEAGADPTTPKALSSAATNFECLDILTEYGADFQNYGWRALDWAINFGPIECVSLLIDLGVDINARDNASTPTALQTAAAKTGGIKLVKLLVEKGADVHASAGWRGGCTALQTAARHGHIEVVDYLLKAGADIDAAPAKVDGLTALEAAATKNHWSRYNKRPIFEQFLGKGACINGRPGDTRGRANTSTLHALIDSGEDELCRLVITKGAGVNLLTSGKEGRTPLQQAAEKGNLELVKLLLEHGAKVNSQPANNYGRTALQAAACCKTPALEIIRLLIENKAAVNAEPATVGGVTALQGAAIRGHVKVALALLDAGAEVNARPAIKDGRTAIEGAAEHGRLDMVQLLLEAGAEGDAERGFESAINLAEENNHFTIANMLRARVPGEQS